MKNNSKELERTMEKATDAGNALPSELDPEVASLREVWLAFGQMLEAAQPPDLDSPIPSLDVPKDSPYLPLSLEERPGMTYMRRHGRIISALAMLAVSLLIAVAVEWVLHNANRQAGSTALPEKTASANHKAVPANASRTQTPGKADEPQWEDSLDEQFAQIDWQMQCVRQNQTLRTDAFGIAEYKLNELSQAIQPDTL